MIALSERERIASERRQVEERLKRLGRAYVDGMITERVYEAESRQLRARLGVGLGVSEQPQIIGALRAPLGARG